MTNIFIETKLYVIILSLLLLLSCQSRENRIRADIAAANKAYCPMKFGNFGSLNSIEFDDGRIIFSYELKEPDLISIISDNDNNKKLFDNYILKIASSSLKNIFSQGYDCVTKYSSPSISQIAVIELNSEEAKRITQEVISKKELAIEGARLSCLVWKRKVPMDLGDGIKITNVSFLNNTIINECEVEDEKKSDLSNLANIINIPDLKKVMLELIFQESHDLLLKQYILGGVSIEYKLLGKKSKTMFSIIISPNEIYEYLKPKEEEARRMKAVYRAIKRQADESNRIK